MAGAIFLISFGALLLILFTVLVTLEITREGFNSFVAGVIIVLLIIIGFIFFLGLRVTYAQGYGNPADYEFLKENEVYQVIWDQQIEPAQSDRIVRIKDKKGNYRIVQLEKSPPAPYFKVKKNNKYILFPPAE